MGDNRVMEILTYRLTEAINGYIINHGLYGDKTEVYPDRLQALKVLSAELDKEIKRERQNLFDGAGLSIVSVDNTTEGGTI